MSVITGYIDELKQCLDLLNEQAIESAIQLLAAARKKGAKIFIMGNGGSASTASHFVCDLAKNTRESGHKAFKVIGLTDNMAIFSALANDEGYDQVFAQQLANLISPNDIVIGISASGNSANVLNGITVARQNEAVTIGFTGFDGGQLAAMVDVNLHVDTNCIEQVEDVHLALVHLIVTAIRQICTAEAPPVQVGLSTSE